MPARELLNAFAKPLFLMLWLITWVIGHSSVAVADDDRPRIVAFGDSLTAGLGVAAEEAYPARLQRRLDEKGLRYRVINAGVSGDTTAGGVRRVDWVLKSRPDLVILELGGNDGLRGLKLDETKANLERIIKRCQDASVTVILAGMKLPPNYGTEYTKRFRGDLSGPRQAVSLDADPVFSRWRGRVGVAQPSRRHSSHKRGLPHHRRQGAGNGEAAAQRKEMR